MVGGPCRVRQAVPEKRDDLATGKYAHRSRTHRGTAAAALGLLRGAPGRPQPPGHWSDAALLGGSGHGRPREPASLISPHITVVDQGSRSRQFGGHLGGGAGGCSSCVPASTPRPTGAIRSVPT